MERLFHSLTRRVEWSAREGAARIFACGTIGLLVFLAFISFLVAAAIRISDLYGPVVAAASIGFFFLAAALVLTLVVNGMRKRRQRRLMIEMENLRRQTTMNIAGTMLPIMLRGSPIGTLALVAGASYILFRGMREK